MTFPFLMKTETDIEKYRAESFWTKEPETIDWIRSMQDGDIFWDIGANVGVYSFYFASLYPNGRVLAFEPSRMNHKRLFENMNLNGFGNVVLLPFALSDRQGSEWFYENSTSIGSSGGQVGIELDDYKEKTAVILTTVDDLVIKSMVRETPNHIKIDVDGQEEKILDGMLYTICKPEVQSILVEVDRGEGFSLFVERVKQCGYTIDNRFNRMENHSRVRRAKEGINCENVVFTRGGNMTTQHMRQRGSVK